MTEKKSDVPLVDTTKNPNAQPSLMGDVRVPFEPTANLRWVRRAVNAEPGSASFATRYVLQQQWVRTVTHATLALKRAQGNARPTVASVWVDVPRGEE